jgi:hypothetical protein
MSNIKKPHLLPAFNGLQVTERAPHPPLRHVSKQEFKSHSFSHPDGQVVPELFEYRHQIQVGK